jgi:uncharacterized membrane protein (UPF0127 family)
LGQDQGMLFIYAEEQYQNFWMKDTVIPLDLAFIREDGKILEIYQMVPYDKTVIRSRNKVKYVLEVNQGWFEEHFIRVGAMVIGLDQVRNDTQK